MASIFNVNFDIRAPFEIGGRLIVDVPDNPDPGQTALTTLTPSYNYRNMIVFVRTEKKFYYLIDTPLVYLTRGSIIADWAVLDISGGSTGPQGFTGHAPARVAGRY